MQPGGRTVATLATVASGDELFHAVDVVERHRHSTARLLRPRKASPKREILLQRISFFIVLWHEDPAQVGMTLESHAEHVVDLSFQPIGGPPKVARAG